MKCSGEPTNVTIKEKDQTMNLINRIVSDDSGAETVEYALVLGLMAIAAIAAITALGTNISNFWSYVSGKITSAS